MLLRMSQRNVSEAFARGGFDFRRGRHRPNFVSRSAPATLGTEHIQQASFFSWLEAHGQMVPLLRLWYAIPNGVHTQAVEYRNRDGERVRYSPAIRKLKEEGLKCGVPDCFWPVARRNFHGLYLEFKLNRNDLTPDQREMRFALETEGYAVHTCWDWTEAARLAIWYAQLRVGRGGLGMASIRSSLPPEKGHNHRCGCDVII